MTWTAALPYVFLAFGVPLLIWGAWQIIALCREPWDEWDEMARKDDEDPKA